MFVDAQLLEKMLMKDSKERYTLEDVALHEWLTRSNEAMWATVNDHQITISKTDMDMALQSVAEGSGITSSESLTPASPVSQQLTANGSVLGSIDMESSSPAPIILPAVDGETVIEQPSLETSTKEHYLGPEWKYDYSEDGFRYAYNIHTGESYWVEEDAQFADDYGNGDNKGSFHQVSTDIQGQDGDQQQPIENGDAQERPLEERGDRENAAKTEGLKWTCPICTYQNYMKSKACVMCGGPRPKNDLSTQPFETWMIPGHNSMEQSQSHTNDVCSASDATKWVNQIKELNEMGFEDNELNMQLLQKYQGR